MSNLKFNIKQPPFIIFCLPGREFSKHFLKSYTDLIGYCHSKGIKFAVSSMYSPVVYYVRNLCLGGDNLKGIHQKPFDNKINYTHTMWIDSDMVFNAQQFEKLLNYDLDIVSGIYPMQGGTKFATVEKKNTEYFSKNGCFKFLTPEDIKDRKKLFEVDYTGFGFILVKRHVFEALEYPWFRPIFQQIGSCYDFASEDASVCLLMKEKGFKIYIDPTIRLGHVKETIL